MSKVRSKRELKVATDEVSSSEVHSIILRGVLCALRSVFITYYVSENIEPLLKYINDRKIITAEEYKRLLAEAKDFYPVIICAVLIEPIKKNTNNFKLRQLDKAKKEKLFKEIHSSLLEFFNKWLCDIELDPLLYYRLGISYNKHFDIGLYIKKQNSYKLTAIEEQIINDQVLEVLCIYLIEEIAIQLGLAGLDYLDYYHLGDNPIDKNKKEEKESIRGESVPLRIG